ARVPGRGELRHPAHSAENELILLPGLCARCRAHAQDQEQRRKYATYRCAHAATILPGSRPSLLWSWTLVTGFAPRLQPRSSHGEAQVSPRDCSIQILVKR